MKLEQQVVSLELAQKLKELGVKQESYFAYHQDNPHEWTLHNVDDISAWGYAEVVYAYNVAELGEMLPLNVMLPHCSENGAWLSSNKENGQWSVYYEGYPKKGTPNREQIGDRITRRQVADTEADARAKMLVYLLENNLITL